MSDKQTHIDTYNALTATLVKVEKAFEITKEKRYATVKAILDAHGKGPHDLGGGKMCIIVNKGETYFFKTATEKKANAEA